MPASPQPNPQNLPLVAPLADFERASLAVAGGKGANLGELSRAGFDVPPGFVITTAAYDLLLQSNGLRPAAVDAADESSLAQASGSLRAAIVSAQIPAQIEAEILSAYRRLGGGAVAVRSSATAEDLPGAAFAGQQETFLNVLDEPALLEAVKACWASLWSERAVLYRARQNVDQAAVKLAVVVQRMAPADAAGVMFTANPVSGSRDELAIDANPGLGEAVVSGMVTPDHYVLEKRRLRLVEQKPGRREVILRPKAGGGTEPIATAPGQKAEACAPVLPLTALRQLARLGQAIERHYGAPQDIEWAWQEDTGGAGRFFILQARPMTALPKLIKTNPILRQVVPMLVEMLPERPYPLDMTTFTGAVEKAVGGLLVELVGKNAPDPSSIHVEEDGVVARFEPPAVHPSPGILIHPWLALWRNRHYDPVRWQADLQLAEVIRQAGVLEQRDLRGLSWQQIVDTLHEMLALIPRAMELRQRYLPKALAGLAGLWLLLKLARRSSTFGVLVSGIETKTTETNHKLDALAVEIRRDPALSDLFSRCEPRQLRAALEQQLSGHAFLEHFDAFLTQYGHREVTLTISQGAWKDQPEIVFSILKVLAAGETHETVNGRAWEEQRQALLAHSILKMWPLRPLFLGSLAGARYLFQIREDTHFYATLVQPPLRGAALELGRRLAEMGALDSAQDVFHLRLEELEALGEPWPPSGEALAEVRDLARRRKAKREALKGTPMVDPRWLTAVLAGSPARPGESILLSGSPGSPGVAGGSVRIVLVSSEFGRLLPGEVLVAPATNPAWTPLFQRAAAVVVDTGGAASHAAIVAREYGVPAVMGTVNGTHKLKDGQRVLVDGGRGLVLKVEEPDENQ